MSFKNIHEILAADDETLVENLDELVHQAASALASNANNGGIAEQVDFLTGVAGWSHNEITEAVNDMRVSEGEA